MLEVCPKRNLFVTFIDWHFHEATTGIVKAWRNFLRFNMRYFSIGDLFRTLFSHWHKTSESYGRGFDFQRFLNVFLGNLISRVLGAIVRLVFIVIGLITELLILAGGLVMLLFWVLLPLWVVGGLLVGIGLLI